MTQYRTFPICSVGDNENVFIIFPEATEERLGETCFRGESLRMAGNFSAWTSFYEMMINQVVRNSLEESVIESVRGYIDSGSTETSFDESVEIACGFNVGWSSTANIENFEDNEIEPFSINARVTGLRVRSDCTKRAPHTSNVTIVYRLFHNIADKDWVAVIYSVYPGDDIGSLAEEDEISDVSAREGIVFFDWNHLGEAD